MGTKNDRHTFWTGWGKDLSYGCRNMLRSPGFTVTAVLTLSLGIGAIAVMFSVVNAVLLHPLPYPQSDRILSVAGRCTGIGIQDDRNRLSAPEFMDLRRFSSAFSDLSAIQPISYSIRVAELPERISGAVVSSNFFRLMGVSPTVGRAFLPEEERAGSDAVVMLSYGLWRRRFGADRDVLGRTVEVSGRACTVIGVMPAGFDYPFQTEMWTPMVFPEAQLRPEARGNHSWIGLARLKPGLTFEQADADMDRVTQQIMESAPEFPYRRANFRILIRPILEDFVGAVRPTIAMLMGAVVMVLLIACVNAANLLMVRASAREREIGIRAALGASRGRLIRQLLLESLVLSFAATAIGVVLAWAGITLIVATCSQALPRLALARMDWATLLFTILVSGATGILFGLAPAWQTTHSCTWKSLKEGGRGSTAGLNPQRLRRFLVTIEVALSLTLLIGTGLLIQSLLRLQEVRPGFAAENVLTMRVVLPRARYGQPEMLRTFYRRLAERISQIPGIESFGAINSLPLSGQGGSGTVLVDTSAVPPEKVTPEADQRIVLPGFFQTMKTSLIAGRFFDERDNETNLPVAIIDKTLADSYWPGETAVGKRIKRGGKVSVDPWLTIVGVVEPIRYDSLERSPRVQLYTPHAQTPATGMSLVIRTKAAATAIGESVQKAVMTLDPDRPVYAVRTMDEWLRESIMTRHVMTHLLGLFAGLALLLVSLGIYGVISSWVSQRTQEIGIRMTLGASRACILQMVMRHVVTVMIAGSVLGLMGALGLSRILAALLYDVEATDPWTYAVYGLVLLGVGALAGLVPAIRATLVNPLRTLRQE